MSNLRLRVLDIGTSFSRASSLTLMFRLLYPLKPGFEVVAGNGHVAMVILPYLSHGCQYSLVYMTIY